MHGDVCAVFCVILKTSLLLLAPLSNPPTYFFRPVSPFTVTSPHACHGGNNHGHWSLVFLLPVNLDPYCDYFIPLFFLFFFSAVSLILSYGDQIQRDVLEVSDLLLLTITILAQLLDNPILVRELFGKLSNLLPERQWKDDEEQGG